METTYTLRYRLSSNPSSLKVLEFNSERSAIEAALNLYTHTRKSYKCYDISINWVTFSASEAKVQLQAYIERLEDYLTYHRTNRIRP